MDELNGLLFVDKPKDWTSFDVVAKVRGIIGQATGEKIKVGHAGTLDPKATGLLILAIGKATKQIDTFMKLDKIYETELTLGKTSTTEDQEGELTEVSERQPTQDEVEAALDTFVGEIEQIPPIFSAIKIDGQRAYKAARAGKPIEMKPRKVTIKSISDLRYNYPKISFVTDVSSGTYIRSLARDIGETLETGAYLSNLRRETVGEFSVQAAIGMDGLNIEIIQSNTIRLDI